MIWSIVLFKYLFNAASLQRRLMPVQVHETASHSATLLSLQKYDLQVQKWDIGLDPYLIPIQISSFAKDRNWMFLTVDGECYLVHGIVESMCE